MGWNDHNDKWIELHEEATELADYYTDITGFDVQADVADTLDEFWVKSNRTNGQEYFSDLREADRRLKILYQDLLPDDGDTTDPYEGL